jgi:hypothetical protein
MGKVVHEYFVATASFDFSFSITSKLPQKYENFLSACQIKQFSRYCITPALIFVILSRITKKSESIMKDNSLFDEKQLSLQKKR